jgi:hypothetical protein
MALTLEQEALDFNPELQDVSRQRKLAELLMAKGLQQPQGQMISGHYVAPSWTQQLNPMANALAGEAVGNRADTKQQELAVALRVQGDKAAQDVMQTYQKDPQAALAKATQYQQYPQVKALLPQLSKVALPEATTLEREFAAAKADPNMPYKGSLNDFKNQMSEYQKSQAADSKQRLSYEGQRVGLEGQRLGLEQQKFAQEMGGAKLTDTQGNATGFGIRAKEANQIVTDLEKKGITIPGKTSTVVSGIAGMTPFAGDKYSEATKSLFNVLPEVAGGLSAEQQQNAQARRNFISAVLRKESGAAIGVDEYKNEEKKYFPQLGEDASVVKQKQQARESAIRALEIQAGPGARFIKESGMPKLSSDDQQALQWANSNPNDPRALKIKQKLGQQ